MRINNRIDIYEAFKLKAVISIDRLNIMKYRDIELEDGETFTKDNIPLRDNTTAIVSGVLGSGDTNWIISQKAMQMEYYHDSSIRSIIVNGHFFKLIEYVFNKKQTPVNELLHILFCVIYYNKKDIILYFINSKIANFNNKNDEYWNARNLYETIPDVILCCIDLNRFEIFKLLIEFFKKNNDIFMPPTFIGNNISRSGRNVPFLSIGLDICFQHACNNGFRHFLEYLLSQMSNPDNVCRNCHIEMNKHYNKNEKIHR